MLLFLDREKRKSAVTASIVALTRFGAGSMVAGNERETFMTDDATKQLAAFIEQQAKADYAEGKEQVEAGTKEVEAGKRKMERAKANEEKAFNITLSGLSRAERNARVAARKEKEKSK